MATNTERVLFGTAIGAFIGAFAYERASKYFYDMADFKIDVAAYLAGGHLPSCNHTFNYDRLVCGIACEWRRVQTLQSFENFWQGLLDNPLVFGKLSDAASRAGQSVDSARELVRTTSPAALYDALPDPRPFTIRALPIFMGVPALPGAAAFYTYDPERRE